MKVVVPGFLCTWMLRAYCWESGMGVPGLRSLSRHPCARQEGEGRGRDVGGAWFDSGEGLEERKPSPGVVGMPHYDEGISHGDPSWRDNSCLFRLVYLTDVNAYTLFGVNQGLKYLSHKGILRKRKFIG